LACTTPHGSGSLAQSEPVFLLFGSKLVLFNSNFFGLDAKFFGNLPCLIIGERFLGPREFSSGKSALSIFWQEGFSFPDSALCKSHLFLLKMLITATTCHRPWLSAIA
jgi:hypothetical protein